MEIVGEIVVTLLIALIVDILLAVLLMWCWNYIAPTVFGLPMIGWWQALVMKVGAGLLFKSVSTSSSK